MLLTISNPKTLKGQKFGWLTGVLSLVPGGKACPSASPGCLKACLNTAGNPLYFKAKFAARKRRAELFMKDRDLFYSILIGEIAKLTYQAKRDRLSPAVRLNGVSDWPWEKIFPDLFGLFPTVQFYDYTKIVSRAVKADLPANYDLTLSRSETNETRCLSALKQGARVSVVFRKDLPKSWNGYRVIDGDQHDLTFLQPKGIVIGLSAKGKAKHDQSGFVIHHSH